MADESVRCWGYNDDGQLGDGVGPDTEIQSTAPVTVVGLHDAVQITVGAKHACALRATHYVVCWGDNEWGQLASSRSVYLSVPVPAEGVGQARYVTAGDSHTCTIAMDRSARCWGYGAFGVTAGGPTPMPVPRTVAGVSDVLAISAGGLHTCAIAGAERHIYCWGTNASGQLGNGQIDARPYHPPVSGTGLTNVTTVDSGYQSTCATTSTHVYCWGYNSNGELGNETPYDNPTGTPVVVKDIVGPIAVSAGEDDACAATAEALYCWGSDGQEGSLGDGPVDSTGQVVQVH
jgi:alpha-tubulin suppressor-like RCC1 family protein